MIPTRQYIMSRVPRPDNTEVLISRVQTAEEITGCVVGSMLKSLSYCGEYAPIFARGNRTVEDICNDIWVFMKENFIFQPEPSEMQTGRSVRYIIWDPVQYSAQLGLSGERMGSYTFDCKHFSTFGLATLRALGIKSNLRLCGYDNSGIPTHVYVVAWDDDGNETILDGTLAEFNKESESTFKINVKEKIEA